MSMAASIKELKALSDEELERRHDLTAQSTQAGVQYYLDEFARREQAKASAEMLRLTQEIHRMTLVITIATIVTVIVAILSLWR